MNNFTIISTFNYDPEIIYIIIMLYIYIKLIFLENNFVWKFIFKERFYIDRIKYLFF